jgi:hypothetical protein
MRRVTLGAICATVAAVALGGCTNPDALSPASGKSSGGFTQNLGEPPAPAPPAPASEAPHEPRSTPSGVLAAFALRYVNWTYRTLAADQRALAAMSVGAARQAELQAAAASAADTTIARARVENSGRLVGVAPDASQPGRWIVVTREQTGGNSEYEGLRASYHVALARVARVADGYAVSQWQPQS